MLLNNNTDINTGKQECEGSPLVFTCCFNKLLSNLKYKYKVSTGFTALQIFRSKLNNVTSLTLYGNDVKRRQRQYKGKLLMRGSYSY